ncbi:MAG: LuxR family transcriptional regulator [Candidatus Zixiibacteriota bacterium]
MHLHRKADPTLVGRQQELAELTEAFTGVRAGHGGLILISGESGIGKTRLATEALERSGLPYYVARAREGATPPYGPFVAILRAWTRRDTDAIGKITRGELRLSLLMPELELPAAESTRVLLADAIGQALQLMASDRACAILLDDIQWADNATLELLPELAERLRDTTVLMLATYRSDDITRTHPLRWMRTELRRARLLRELTVGALNRDHTRTLMTECLPSAPSESFVDDIYTRTQGIPLYIEESVRTLLNTGRLQEGEHGMELSPGESVPIPESIRDAVMLQLETLPIESRDVLETAAIAGLEFDFDMIATLTGHEEPIEPLLERRLLLESGPATGTFKHTLIRDAIQSEITWSRRRTLHRRIASYLESHGAEAELIAAHWLASNELAKARRALLAAADHSCRLHAYRDAAEAAARALDIWPEDEDEGQRLSTLERLAHCAQISGQLNDAVRAWREFANSPSVMHDHQRLGHAYRQLATLYGLQSLWDQSIDTRLIAANHFRQAGQPADAAVEYLTAAGRYTAALQLSDAIDAARLAERLAREAHDRDTEARALGLRGNVMAMQGEYNNGRETVQRALALALKHDLTDAASEIYRRLASTLEYANDYGSAKDAYLTAYDYCRKTGADENAQICLSCMSYVLFYTGDWKRALETCNNVINDDHSPPGSKAVALGVVAAIRTHRGETRAARRLLNEALAEARRHGSPIMQLLNTWGLAALAEYEHDREHASRCYHTILDGWAKTEDRHDLIPALRSAATFFATQNADSELSQCVDALSNLASTSSSQEVVAAVAHALGEAAMRNGNDEEAARHFEQSASTLEKLGLPLEVVKSRWRGGIALHRAGHSRRGSDMLSQAHKIARNLGARPLASAIAAELERHGEPVEESRSSESPDRTRRAGLTRRQLDIVRLLAEGLTNKQIADKLFLSTRTVDMHVANLLNRLDVRSRTEAVHKAGELGLLSN